MEKISSILPSNPRVKSVDMEDAHPIRPGVPAFGRPVGTTSSQRNEDKVTVSQKAKELLNNETILSKSNKKPDRGAEIADAVTKKFFETRLQPSPAKEAAEPTPVEAAPITEDIQTLAKDTAALSADAEVDEADGIETNPYISAPIVGQGKNDGRPSLSIRA